MQCSSMEVVEWRHKYSRDNLSNEFPSWPYRQGDIRTFSLSPNLTNQAEGQVVNVRSANTEQIY